MTRAYRSSSTLIVAMIAAVPACTTPSPAISLTALSSCGSGDVVVSAAGTSSGMGHRDVELAFGLAPHRAPCTLTGYPGVDTGAGGPLLHAERTMSGYMSGATRITTITVDSDHPATADIEGVATNANGDQCPFYTNLLVTPPNTTATVLVDATIDTCRLQVHPVR